MELVFACICTQLRCANICTKFSRRNSRPPIFYLYSVFVAEVVPKKNINLTHTFRKVDNDQRKCNQLSSLLLQGRSIICCNTSREGYFISNCNLIESIFF